MIEAAIDHLVVTSPSLRAGAEYVRGELGVEMQPGGAHAAMGTHNLLLKLDDSTYLEVIAVDPDVTAPGTPRWFDLDHVTAPGLATWVARVNDIHVAAEVLGIPREHIKPMSRGALNWLITIPGDGSIQSSMPALIQWLNGPHPAAGMPDSGCSLIELRAAPLWHTALDPRCKPGDTLSAAIQCPRGLRTLRTSSSA